MADQLIRIDGITVAFGGVTALTDVHMVLGEHPVHAIIGPNGAGKSTLFNVITGQIRPRRGTVTYRGSNLAARSPAQIYRGGIARTFQNVRLTDEMTVLENVEAALDISTSTFLTALRPWRAETTKREAARAALELVRFPAKRMVTRPPELPLGLRRLAEVARASVRNPDFVLLDEPASGLSLPEKHHVATVIKDLVARSVKVVVVEHDMNFLMPLVDRLYVLDRGRVIAEGTPGDIQADTRVRLAYLGGETVG